MVARNDALDHRAECTVTPPMSDLIARASIRVAELGPGPGFQAGEPRALFRVAFLPDFSGFDVLPGDSLFVLYASTQTDPERIFVVANFLEKLRTLTAPHGTARK